MSVLPINSLDQFKKIINDGDALVAIDFWATWCGPCRFVSPVFEKLSDESPNVRAYKVDVDAVPDLAEEVGIRAMPTFIFFKNGEKIESLVGADPSKLTQLFRSLS